MEDTDKLVSDRVAVFKCKCHHEYQDTTYGKGKRVHNWADGVKPNGAWRCTVCGNVRT